MDNTFISNLLLLCLSLLLIMYLCQNKNTIKAPIKSMLPVIHNVHNSHNSHNSHNILTSCNSNRPDRMPIHRIGPIINFHQHFTKYTNNPTYTTVKGCGNPTGIPELGWRNMYISNYSKNEVPEVDPFSGIVTRNFLDNMQSLDNIYRQCL